MRVLVVDDEIRVASVLAEAVKQQGHQVIMAQDADEALALLTHDRPDAMLLDVRLKELNGIDLLRKIRKTDQRLPVVLITGNATAEQLREATQLGVTDIIMKPFVLARLTESLRRAEEMP